MFYVEISTIDPEDGASEHYGYYKDPEDAKKAIDKIAEEEMEEEE